MLTILGDNGDEGKKKGGRYIMPVGVENIHSVFPFRMDTTIVPPEGSKTDQNF